MGVATADLATIRDRVYRSVVLALEHAVAGQGEDGEAMVLGDVLADRTAAEPAESLEARELLGYLRDAIDLLPERHRIVIVGYFLDNRTSLELADELRGHRVADLPDPQRGARDAAHGHRRPVRPRPPRSPRPVAPPAARPSTPRPSGARRPGGTASSLRPDDLVTR